MLPDCCSLPLCANASTLTTVVFSAKRAPCLGLIQVPYLTILGVQAASYNGTFKNRTEDWIYDTRSNALPSMPQNNAGGRYIERTTRVRRLVNWNLVMHHSE
jgi:hypothetical protein